MQTASMFLSELSVVDHAWIDGEGHIVGGSFNPNFLVHGPVDPIESVVVDFSTVKKTIKGLLDHDDFGFDHKLWLVKGLSDVKFSIYRDDPNAGELNNWDVAEPIADDDRRIRIDCDGELDLPLNAVKFINNPEWHVYGTQAAGRWMEDDLNRRISSLHPGVSVECRNSTARHTFNPSLFDGSEATDLVCAEFRYVHGLKDSTSWGCQNIAHGHLSFVQLIPESGAGHSVRLQALADEIAGELNNVVFVRQDNIASESEAGLEIEYSCSRGKFKFQVGPGHKTVTLDTETTIEFLVDYVARRWESELHWAGCYWLFVSEGLTKGASVKMGEKIVG